MRQAERLAWGAMWGLVVIAAILIAGAFAYRFTGFWAGAMLVSAQALVVGLAAWGLGLARQAAELRALSPVSTSSGTPETGFRMSMGGELESSRRTTGERTEETHTLDTSFQRLLIGIGGGLFLGLTAILVWAIYSSYQWSLENPTVKFPIVGTLTDAAAGKSVPMDDLCLLIGLAGAMLYGALYWITRPTRQTEGYADAVNSTFTLGLAGMAALGVATVLGRFQVAWASETAAGIIAAFMALQGLELLVNCVRNYSGIEEFDQEAVDLQATPLTPMLESVWLGGLQMLFAQSLGLSGGGVKGERSVISRMMPRTLAAILVLAIGASCIRVVPPGQVAVIERLGYAALEEDGRPAASAILHPGMHVTFPWPIDELVYVPTEELQLVDVGTELHASGDWKNVDFQFWTIRPPSSDAEEMDDLFITGDPGSPQFLETYVQVRWRVADPARFYAAVSHSQFYESAGGGARSLPIYAALVQQCTSFAVTRTFAIHTLDQLLITDRAEAEQHCRQLLQDKLDALCALPGDKPGQPTRGIEVVYLTIKDLHPPFRGPDRPHSGKPAIGGKIVQDANGFRVEDDPDRTSRIARGPASAFELVVSMREFKEQLINYAQAQAIAMKNQAHGDALSEIARAHAYAADRVAQARGEADRLVEMSANMSNDDLLLLKRKLFFDTTPPLFGPVPKIVVDPDVKDLQIYQGTDRGSYRPLQSQ